MKLGRFSCLKFYVFLVSTLFETNIARENGLFCRGEVVVLGIFLEVQRPSQQVFGCFNLVFGSVG